MISKFKQIFKDEWKDIFKIYKDFSFAAGAQADDKFLLAFLEVGARLGERLFQIPAGRFVEIGCGMAIPSLSLVKLGHTNVTAIDIEPKILSYAEAIRKVVECQLDIQCYDIFEKRPKLENNDMLIAEKPASYKKHPLEVEYMIMNWCKIEGYDFAIIPSFLKTDTIDSYSDRCEKYQRRLKQVGFKVENKKACDQLPYRWLIAVKWSRSL